LPNLATGAIVQKRKKLMDQMLVHRLITTINCIIITSATKQGPPYPLPRYNPALLIPSAGSGQVYRRVPAERFVHISTGRLRARACRRRSFGA